MKVKLKAFLYFVFNSAIAWIASGFIGHEDRLVVYIMIFSGMMALNFFQFKIEQEEKNKRFYELYMLTGKMIDLDKGVKDD